VPDAAVRGLAALLALGGGAAVVIGWSRVRKVEVAIAEGRPVPPLRAHVALAVVVGLVAAMVVLLIFV
jgi:uncharacterized membrane protein YidH (DUF202 family)